MSGAHAAGPRRTPLRRLSYSAFALAIIAVFFGLLPWLQFYSVYILVSLIAAVGAIVLGHVASHKYKKTEGSKEGRWAARPAIIIGYAFLTVKYLPFLYITGWFLLMGLSGAH
jgi:NADH:ubiquinone oxidoreductase subunit 6 (subunit J)